MPIRHIVSACVSILSLTLAAGCSQTPGKATRADRPVGTQPAEEKLTPIQTLAVAPLLAEDPDQAWLGEAIAASLNARLFHRPDVGSYTTRQVEAGMRQAQVSLEELSTKPASARDVGRHLGAQFLVVGGISLDAGAVSGEARILEVSSGDERAKVKIAGPVGELGKAVDAVAAEIAKVVGGDLEAPRDGAGPPIEALEAATRAFMLLREQSLSPRAANPQVQLQISAERLAQARDLAKKATAVAPKFPCGWVALALAKAMAGEPDKATELLNKARDVAPRDSPRMVLVRAFVAMRQGKFDRAEVVLRKALEAHPGFLHGRGSLAELLLHFGRLRESRHAFERYLQLNPGHPWVMAKIGYVNSKLGQDDLAIEMTQQAVNLLPDSTYLLTELASRQIDVGDLAGAQTSLERVLELAPDHARAQVRLGYVKLLRGDDEGAIAISQRVIETARGSRNRRERAYAHLNLARAYGHQGKVDESLEQLAMARKEAEINLDEFELDEALKPVREDPRYMEIVE